MDPSGTRREKAGNDQGWAYSAREAYRDYSIGEHYERDRFSSRAGRYRLHREQRAVISLLDRVEAGASMLDCPCGTGRWWPLLMRKAGTLTAVDLSPGMLTHARDRAAGLEHVEVLEGDAEALPLADASVDWAFSYALTKHLPRPVQYTVLSELGRVARRGVICSFGVVNHVTYEVWRRRYRTWRRRGLDESIPLLAEELEAMADRASLDLVDRRRATTPLGVEYVCLMTKRVAEVNRGPDSVARGPAPT